MTILLKVTLSEATNSGGGLMGSSVQHLKEAFESMLDSYVIDGWKVLDSKVLDVSPNAK